MINNRSSGFTLVETIIAAGVFTLFFGAALGLFFQSQRTINRVSWNNSVTKDAGLALRNFSELAKTSSYPSTVRSNLIKVADVAEDFKAKLPSGTGLIKYSGANRNLLAFPVCKEQTETEPGTIKWVSIWLEKSDSPGFQISLCMFQAPSALTQGHLILPQISAPENISRRIKLESVL
ncbi:MAG TPA: type II secretion system protein [Candidatus Rifleibacterium sp.]|nr:type II secretion system protein [Candidatus Rifleibacterium sp.]